MAINISKNIFVRDYVAGDSIPMIASRYAVSRSTVRLAVFTAGVIRERGDAIRLAKPRLGSGLRGKTRVFSQAHKEAISKSAAARGEATAKGVSLKPAGYIELTRGKHKGKTQHKIIAEQILGRALSSDECVHHEDHNRSNNSPANLKVMTKSSHARLHGLENHHKRKRDQLGRFT